MAKFSLCRMQGAKAIKYHHSYEGFDFYICEDSEEVNKIIFKSSAPMTDSTKTMVGEEAIKQVIEFGQMVGYDTPDEVKFNDVINILEKAKKYAGKTA